MPVDIYAPTYNDDLGLEELRLYHLLMEYRAQNGLGAVPLSKALTTTAGRHAVDSYHNIFKPGLVLPPGANLHSWSDAPYFADHSKPEVMWEAPERLGTGYLDNGFEISAAGFADVAAALEGWKGSPAHNDVILNRNVWGGFPWSAIGIGVEIHPEYRVYHVWFGAAADPSGVAGIRAGNRADTVSATGFGDRIFGLGGNDRLLGEAGNDTIYGGTGDDRAFGGAGADRLDGGTGADTLNGGDSNDRLFGGEGDDSLLGGPGNDTLEGGQGNDRMAGQGGADRFLFDAPGGADVVTDFADGLDRIVIGDGTGFDSYAGLRGAIREVAAGVRILFAPGESVLLQGVARADITGADFIFA